MAFGIPNAAQAAFPAQAAPDAVDIAILVAGIVGTGVLTGCAVDEGTSATNMLLTVTAGTIRFAAGQNIAVASATPTVPGAHSTLPRFDLVVVNNSAAVSVTAGTAAAAPVFPAIPFASLVLAAVYVPAGDTGIANNQIIDKRVTPHVLPLGDSSVNHVGWAAPADLAMTDGGDIPVYTDAFGGARSILKTTGASDGDVLQVDSGAGVGVSWGEVAGLAPSTSVTVVNHGTNANVARPSGWGTVIWKGSAVPVNFSTGDDIRINPT